MADTIEQLKDKLTALEADSGGNKDRKKLEVALELCAALAALDMKRGVVQYADLAIDLDHHCVPAHCFRAEALQAMAQERPSSKAAAKRGEGVRQGPGRVRPLRRARGAAPGCRAAARSSTGALCRRRRRKRRRRSPERNRRRSSRRPSWIYPPRSAESGRDRPTLNALPTCEAPAAAP